MSGIVASSDAKNSSDVMDILIEGAFSAYVDMRDLGFDCSMLAGLLPGLACSECPGEPGVDQCVVFDIIDIPGVLVDDLTLVPISEADVENNPDCG